MKKIVALLVLALATLALASCGGGDDDETTTATSGNDGAAQTGGAAQDEGGGEGAGGGSTVKFVADPGGGLAYTSDSATAKAGKVTLDFENPQAISHDVRIEDSSGKDLGGTDIIADESTTATVNLKPGTYTFYCSVPGHREAGMEGTLAVK